MKRHAHAVLAGRLIGLICIGASLPMLFSLVGKVVENAVPLWIPDNPGEAGYLPLILDWIAGLVINTLSLIFSLEWFLPNAATMAMLIFGVLLMRSRPRWFIRRIERSMA